MLSAATRRDAGPDAEERVVLVDEHDAPLGTAEKLRAHVEGRLHRAFSVFVFDAAGRVLLQRRAWEKYHSPGLWSNTCCSHPRPGEDTADAAHRRLREEMGFDCALVPAFSFVYRAALGNGLTEHELDHVFVGTFDGRPACNPAEVAGWRWAPVRAVLRDLDHRPARYSVWFHIAMRRVARELAPAHAAAPDRRAS